MSIFDALEGAKSLDKKRTTCPVKYTWIKDSIANYCKENPRPYRFSTIHSSTVGRNMCPRAFVLNYWRPEMVVSDINRELYIHMGNAVHNTVQRLLGECGALKGNWVSENGDMIENSYRPGDGYNYEEIRAFHPQYRFAIRLDGILDIDALKLLKKEWHVDLPKSGQEEHLEIKTTGSRGYKELKNPEDIRYEYRMQATITQYTLGFDRTLFWFVSRDNLAGKMMYYEAEPELWERATNFAKTVWTHIKNETLPEPLEPIKDDPWKEIDFTQWVQPFKEHKEEIYLGDALTHE